MRVSEERAAQIKAEQQQATADREGLTPAYREYGYEIMQHEHEVLGHTVEGGPLPQQRELARGRAADREAELEAG